MYLQRGYYLHNNKYQILNVLGEGGFSLTYRGLWKTEVQGALGKLSAGIPICIKEFFFKDYCRRNPQTCFVETNNETAEEIFNKNKEKIVREARILSEIHNPNVVNVLEVFKQNNTVYIVMEFISGRSLKHEIEKNWVLQEDKLKKIIFAIGQALDYIHKKNILHLDIKPSNILMDNNDNPKLIDFGISKKYDLSNDQETSTALLAASKGYASIEQYDSEGIQVFSPCPDIYSLGATMYYLVTGQVPTESILRSTKGLKNPREINPTVSENTEKVILKAMAINAADRYQTVMEMLLDLGFDAAIHKTGIASTSSQDYSETLSKMGGEPLDFDIEDETMVRTSTTSVRRRKKKQKKYGWLFLIIPFLVSGIMALILFYDFGKKIQDDPGIDPVTINNGQDSVETIVRQPETVQTNTKSPDTSSAPVDNKNISQLDSIQLNFQKAFDDAKNALNQGEFNLALDFINKAESYNKNADTEQYRNQIEKEIEKKEIQERKNLYTFIVKFSIFDVVKRRSDGRVGGTDEKGFEKIPFIYKATEPSLISGHRLFQKDDNSYDRYSPSGICVESGFDID